MDQKHIIVVLGMHRSGTSAITRGLQVLGVNLGERLMAASSGNNEKGFWEDLDVNALNIELLSTFGYDWNSLTTLLPSELASPAVSNLRLRAVQLLRSKLSTADCFGLKDPRIAKLLPFWLSVFSHLNIRISYVIAVRNPMSVGRSLVKRDGLAIEKAYQLWLEHMSGSLSETQGQLRVIVDYDLLMDNPARQLQRVAQSLNLEFDPSSHAYTEYCADFLEEGLRHNYFVEDDLALDELASPLIKELYHTLLDLATDKLTPDAPEVKTLLEKITESFRQNYSLLHYTDQREKDLVEAINRATAQEGVLAESEAQKTSLIELIAERETQNSSLIELIAEREAQSSNLIGLVAERENQITELTTSIADRDTQNASLNGSIAERESQLHELSLLIKDQKAQICILEDSINLIKNELHKEQEAYRGNETLQHSLYEHISQLELALNAIRRSTSWRITKPLRLISRLIKGERPLVSGGMRMRVLHHAKRIYWNIPSKHRNRLLYCGYRNLGPLFKGVNHYEQWKAATNGSNKLNLNDNHLLLIDSLPMASEAYGSIAIHLHMFYEDLAEEFSKLLRNIPYPYDLYVSVASPVGQATCHSSFFGLPRQGKLVIEQVANHGRDIAPMFCTFGSRLKDYDFIAHLHSKKSLYNKGATEGWRQYLCGNLLGSEDRIRRIIALMQGETPRGIVYPQNYHLVPYAANSWLANKAMGTQWCARLGISPMPHGYFDFPAGSMFWARGDALKPLFETGITITDFAEEASQTDGTFAHCLERLLALTSISQGYSPGIIKDLQNPTWSAWRFDQYTARPFQYIAEQLSAPESKLIGFDIFDTLLCRPMMDPEAVKEIVARRIGGQTGQLYLEFRAVAEGQAREAAGRDIGMTEIYARLGTLTSLSEEALSELRTLEEDTEKASVGPRSGGLELYQHALSTGKRIALISDMFLPKEVIEESLRASGITHWDKLFLSGEIGLRKDTGELYEHVFSYYSIKPVEFIMIGDNERSDLQIPADKGVKCIPVLKALEMARGLPRLRAIIERNELNGTLDDQLSLGLVVQKNFSEVCFPQLDPSALFQPTAFNIGYSLAGPLLASFSHWLLEKIRHDGVDRLYFLAREGQILKQAYDLWSEGLEGLPRSEYLILSRRTVTVPMLECLDDILNIAKTTYYPNSLENFLFERYGLQLSVERWKQIHNELHWSESRTVEVQNQQIGELMPLLRHLEHDILEVAKRERDALDHYLDNMNLNTSGRQAVVDVGYGASIQNHLNNLTKTSTHGYYLITDERSLNVAKEHNVFVKGSFFENVERNDNAPIMYLRSFELEKMLSSSDAQVVNYSLDQENRLTSNHRSLSPEETACAGFREELQAGILRYIHDAREIRQNIFPDFTPSQAVAKQLYEEFINHTSQSENELLRKVSLDDYYCGRGVVN